MVVPRGGRGNETTGCVSCGERRGIAVDERFADGPGANAARLHDPLGIRHAAGVAVDAQRQSRSPSTARAFCGPAEDRTRVRRPQRCDRIAAGGDLGRGLGIRPIGVRDNIFDLGVYSCSLRSSVRIEKTFGKKLPPAPLFQAPTIEQLAEHLRQRKGAGRLTSLVAIQPNGARPPVFCVPGGAGTIVLLHKLSAARADQPFYGLQSQGLRGRVALPKTVEEMAAQLHYEIRSVFPDGPYHLAGYCFGGVVALEMAHQLATIGQKVAIVILLNTPAPRLLEPTEVAAAGPP